MLPEKAPGPTDSSDPVGSAIEGAVRAFFATIAGPLVELGEWGADVIRRQRFKGQVRTLTMAREMLAEAGLEAHAVPANQLVPLLELAGLEADDQPDMHRRWAALLANAAAGGDTPDVLPSYPRILSELTPVEAKMLDWLAQDGMGSADLDAFMAQGGFDPIPADGLRKTFPYSVYVDNLERLQLVKVHNPDRALAELARKVDVRGIFAGPSWPSVGITALGTAFVAACAPPPRDAGE